MEAYVSTLAAAVANPRSVGMLIASTARRGRIDALTFSSQAAPADNTLVVTAQRFTASGTATAKTAVKKDPAAPASSCTTEENASVEPTYTVPHMQALTDLLAQKMRKAG